MKATVRPSGAWTCIRVPATAPCALGTMNETVPFGLTSNCGRISTDEGEVRPPVRAAFWRFGVRPDRGACAALWRRRLDEQAHTHPASCTLPVLSGTIDPDGEG